MNISEKLFFQTTSIYPELTKRLYYILWICLTILTFPSANGKCHSMFLLDLFVREFDQSRGSRAKPLHSTEDGIDPNSNPVLWGDANRILKTTASRTWKLRGMRSCGKTHTPANAHGSRRKLLLTRQRLKKRASVLLPPPSRTCQHPHHHSNQAPINSSFQTRFTFSGQSDITYTYYSDTYLSNKVIVKSVFVFIYNSSLASKVKVFEKHKKRTYSQKHRFL